MALLICMSQPTLASISRCQTSASCSCSLGMQEDRSERGKAWQQVQKEAEALAQVQRRAYETLDAIRATSAALTAAEAAVDAVERAKGRPNDPVSPATVADDHSGCTCVRLSMALLQAGSCSA